MLSRKSTFATWLSAAMLMLSSFYSYAQVDLDSAQVASFLDGVIKVHMDEKNIAGATMVMVKDGEVFLEKGYGYADHADRRPVLVDKTLFRIGSISKLFNWLAVMQMVELGKLDLDADVNNYLEHFKVPDTFDQPVTLRSLMTHTPGFEDVVLKLFVRDSTDMMPLHQIFEQQMPARVRPPLQVASYSNHGTGLAQYLVEQKSGKAFETYVEDHVLSLLGLDNTTFRQPLPVNMREYMSKGYKYENGSYKEKNFEYVPMSGVGGASTTASDMGRFMLALLNNTCLGDTCLLDSALYAMMKEPVLSQAQGVNPSLLGFMDISHNNVRIIGHGGDTFWFHSLLAIFPDHDLGLFISFNSQRGAEVYWDVLRKFTDRYLALDRPNDHLQLSDDYLDRFAGHYKMNRHPYSDITKFIGLLTVFNIEVDNGRLLVPGLGGEMEVYVPVDSARFVKEGSNESLVFSANDLGEVTHAFFGELSIVALERLTGAWSLPMHIIILVLTMLTILFILLFWPWVFFIRRGYSPEYGTSLPLPLPFKVAAYLCASSLMVFYILFSIGSSVQEEIVFGIPRTISIALIFPMLSIIFLVLMVVQSFRVWSLPKAGLRSKLFYCLATLVLIAHLWQLYFFNLLGWRY